MIAENFLLLVFAFAAGFWCCTCLVQYTFSEDVFDKWERVRNWFIFLAVSVIAALQALEVM